MVRKLGQGHKTGLLLNQWYVSRGHVTLAILANRMPWQEIEASLAHRFARQVRSGKKIENMDMFGATQVVAGAGVSNAGRTSLLTRLMVSLLYLKHAFNESDEDVVQRWCETPELAP